MNSLFIENLPKGPLNPFPRIASNLATLFSKASKAALSWQKPLLNKKITKITRNANILKMYEQGEFPY